MYDSYFQVDECIIAKFYLNYLAILSYTFYPEEKLTNWVTDLQCKQCHTDEWKNYFPPDV